MYYSGHSLHNVSLFPLHIALKYCFFPLCCQFITGLSPSPPPVCCQCPFIHLAEEIKGRASFLSKETTHWQGSILDQLGQFAECCMTVKFSGQGQETAFESYIPDQFTLYNDPNWNLIHTVFVTLITIKHQSHLMSSSHSAFCKIPLPMPDKSYKVITFQSAGLYVTLNPNSNMKIFGKLKEENRKVKNAFYE